MTHDGEGARGGARGASSVVRVVRALLAALALVLASLVAREARADHFEVGDTGWQGGSELYDIARNELGAARVRAVAVLDWSEIGPEDGILAIHPLQSMDPDDSASFMKAGGRLAILLDEDGAGEDTLSRFRIYRVPPPSRPLGMLRQRPAFAFAEPVMDVVAGHSGGPHPVVAHVQTLVTNRPTCLQHNLLTQVLRIRSVDQGEYTLAVAGLVGRGRLFAMGDASSVINQMLRYPGNRAFAEGLVRYLVDDDGTTRRQGKLYIVTNRFSEEGSYGGQSTPLKDIESWRRSVSSSFEEWRRSGFPPWAHLVLAAALALGLAAWVARASARPYQSPLPRYARPTPLVAQGGVAGRFAVLAAPTSPRSLALLELKSALYEALQLRLGLTAEPSPDALARMVVKAGSLDGGAYSALNEILAMMHDVESAVAAGRTAGVAKKDLARAAEVVREVLEKVPGRDGERGRDGEPGRGSPNPSGDSADAMGSPAGVPAASPSVQKTPHAGESAG